MFFPFVLLRLDYWNVMGISDACLERTKLNEIEQLGNKSDVWDSTCLLVECRMCRPFQPPKKRGLRKILMNSLCILKDRIHISWFHVPWSCQAWALLATPPDLHDPCDPCDLWSPSFHLMCPQEKWQRWTCLGCCSAAPKMRRCRQNRLNLREDRGLGAPVGNS